MWHRHREDDVISSTQAVPLSTDLDHRLSAEHVSALFERVDVAGQSSTALEADEPELSVNGASLPAHEAAVRVAGGAGTVVVSPIVTERPAPLGGEVHLVFLPLALRPNAHPEEPRQPRTRTVIRAGCTVPLYKALQTTALTGTVHGAAQARTSREFVASTSAIHQLPQLQAPWARCYPQLQVCNESLDRDERPA